ncbi:MAG: magnesium-translocating P-type ATPase [Acidobacteria bacterium]|nr:magnesium-translocating P-type ATPase [Acidobacteriota bacterium]
MPPKKKGIWSHLLNNKAEPQKRAELIRDFSQYEHRLIELCSQSLTDALGQLQASLQGLTTEQADDRLNEFGPNELSSKKKLNFWADIGRRLKSPLVIQLLAIAVISAIIGESKSTIIVSLMVLLSIGLSYVLDNRSFQAVEALGKRVQSRTLVLRNGVETEIKISEVVPGDLVILQAGSIIPADIRLVAAKDFFVSESALTGESMPVEKTSTAPASPVKSALELNNACFLGTFVTSGTARGVVINTGRQTLYGAISEKLAEQPPLTSFDRGVSGFTFLMIRFMLIMVFAVFMIVGLTKGNWLEALLFAVSVAVGLTPEMLPMIMTVNLAKGALSMAKKKVIVKQLPAIQNFGAMNVLCTDKTGTLTQDRVVLEKHVDILGNTSEDVMNYAYLNSYFETGLKNLIDRAILEHEELEVGENCRLVDELPFDFERRRMSVVVDYEDDHVLICKGAVEEIYSCCSSYQIGDEVYPLIEMIRTDLFEEVERLNREGFRVLGIAYREFPKTKTVFTTQDENQLILLGYIAFFDPPKGQASEAISLLKKAGIKVKVLTGDNGLVTEKICHEVGIEIAGLVTGADLTNLPPEDFSKVVETNNVFVKLSPSQKEEIVEALRKGGQVVGFLGDGINDAPALRAADVGISVDSAVDVAKESADIILLVKSLLVLEEGIMEGRRVFANITKYIRMAASSNFGNMLSVVGASYLLPFLPMRPIQILTNNLLYDFSQTGIPSDRVDEEQVAAPRKWDIGQIKKFMLSLGPVSSIFDYATFGLMWFVFNCRGFLDPAVSASQKEFLAKLFQTGWFVESLLTQTLVVHIIRTRKIPFIQSRPSSQLLLTTLAIMLFGAWLPYSGLAPALGLVPLPASYWLWIAGFLLAYSVLAHQVKGWFFKKFGGV